MNLLAISDSRVDSGIALYKEDKLVFAVNEERLTREKFKGGFPKKSLLYAIDNYPDFFEQVDNILFAGIFTPVPISRIFGLSPDICYDSSKSFFGKLYAHLVSFAMFRLHLNGIKYDSILGKILSPFVKFFVRFRLPRFLRNIPVELVEHHLCHASAAFFNSGFDKALIVSFDGMGDGYSGKIYSGNPTKLTEIYSANAFDSFGEFYSMVTVYLGFKADRHEGKITGLAAFGDWKNINEKFPFEIIKKDSSLTLKCKITFGETGLSYLRKKFATHKREDVAAWLQHYTEKFVCEIVDFYMKKSGHENVCLVGGLFGNVKLNQRIHELESVKKTYIYPAMGDTGLSDGAILAILKKRKVLNHVYLGPGYTNTFIESLLKKHDVNYEIVSDIAIRVAKLISQGKIVARFNGRMEYGPRALGNRSVLVQATDNSINDTLNKKLKRTEFMPFAPAILDLHADKCIKNLHGAELTSRFMNIAFDVTDYMKKKSPAAVHIDGTARPQILHKNDNPDFYAILSEYYKITGIPAIINTSFNMHEEPIVMTPKDALRGFFSAKLDYLAIGNFLVSFEKNSRFKDFDF